MALLARITTCAVLASPAAPAAFGVSASGQASSPATQPGDEELGRMLLDRVPDASADPKTLDELIRGLKVDRKAADRVLRQMIADGKVKRTGDGTPESPYKYGKRGSSG